MPAKNPMVTIGPRTNITEKDRDLFQAIRSGEYDSFALFSCFFDGEPTSVIANVTKNAEGYHVQPLFVAVTESMLDRLTDHDGRVPEDELEDPN
jgi:hypothetical protein